MPLSTPQKTVDSSEARYIVLVAGRRWGKTFLVRRTLAKWAREPNRLIYAIYPTYRQGKQVLWNSLKNKMIDLKWAKKINETDLSIQLVNGSTIAIRGADNYANLRGVRLAGAIFDEFSQVPMEAWTEVVLPALSDTKDSKAMFVGTPDGFNHFYDIYNKAKTEKNWEAFQYTTAEGGFVDPIEIENARSYMDEKTWEQEFFGKFKNYTGVVSTIQETNIVQKPDVKPQGTIWVGIDFNLDPITATVAVRQGNEHIHFIDEIEMYGSRTEELVDEIKRRYPGQRVMAYPDASGNHRSTNSNQTDHMILRNAGFQVFAPNRNPPIRDRINALNSRLCSANNQHYVTFEPTCRRLIESLRKLPYRKGTNLPDKSTGWDHLFDSCSYMVSYLYPIRRDNAGETQPKRWGMQTV